MSSPDQVMRVLRVVCGAFAAAVVLYGFVGFTVQPAGTGAPPLLVPILVGAGVVAVATAELLKVLMLRSDAAAPQARTFFAATLVAFALREAAALFGLIIALATGQKTWLLGLCVLALAAMTLGWPRRSQLDDHLAARDA